MINDIINRDNLIKHANKLKAKGFNSGIDGMNIHSALLWLEVNADSLCKKILSCDYKPMPFIGFNISKNNGSFRTISKATAIDTILQNAILDGIYDIIDNYLPDNCFAYRKNKGVSAALAMYCSYSSIHNFVAKIDPISFFDNVDYQILEEKLKSCIKDKALIHLIMSFVKVPIEIENEIVYRYKGLPQGATISAILSNLYLNSIDTILSQKNIDYIRYADDIVVFADTLDEINFIVDIVKKELENLKLNINQNKLKITVPTNLTFLGHKFTKTKHGTIANQNNIDYKFTANWKSNIPNNNHRCINIISDGILKQKDFSLIYQTNQDNIELPIRETESINIYSNVVLDSGVLKKAFDNKVLINIFSKENHLLGRFLPNTSLHSPSVLFEQLNTYYDNLKRIELAKAFLLSSFHNTRLVIRYYNKQNTKLIYTRTITQLNSICNKIKTEQNYDNLLILEAQGRNAYYSCFDDFVANSDFVFEKRTRKPPKNEINSLISFGNTLLYNFIATEIYKSSLDIRVGFLHSTNRRKESLNLDIAEIFKPLLVDRTVFTMINRKELSKDMFNTDNNAVYLNNHGKRLFISNFNDKLDTSLQILDEHLTYRQIIQKEIQKLVRVFRYNEQYKPFKQVR